MNLFELERHPLSALWGDMPPDEYAALAADIAEHGVKTPVTLHPDGRVLDGWHRVRGARDAGEDRIETVTLPDGEDPKDFVIRANGLRRHLPKDRRVAIILMTREWVPCGDSSRFEGGNNASSGQQLSTGRAHNAHAPAHEGRTTPPLTEQQVAEQAGASVSMVKKVKAEIRRGHGEDLVEGRETIRSLETKRKAAQRKEDKAKLGRPATPMEKRDQRIADLEAQLDAAQTLSEGDDEDLQRKVEVLAAERVRLTQLLKERDARITELELELEGSQKRVGTLMRDNADMKARLGILPPSFASEAPDTEETPPPAPERREPPPPPPTAPPAAPNTPAADPGSPVRPADIQGLRSWMREIGQDEVLDEETRARLDAWIKKTTDMDSRGVEFLGLRMALMRSLNRQTFLDLKHHLR